MEKQGFGAWSGTNNVARSTRPGPLGNVEPCLRHASSNAPDQPIRNSHNDEMTPQFLRQRLSNVIGSDTRSQPLRAIEQQVCAKPYTTLESHVQDLIAWRDEYFRTEFPVRTRFALGVPGNLSRIPIRVKTDGLGLMGSVGFIAGVTKGALVACTVCGFLWDADAAIPGEETGQRALWMLSAAKDAPRFWFGAWRHEGGKLVDLKVNREHPTVTSAVEGLFFNPEASIWPGNN